jgi:hypothetical protein
LIASNVTIIFIETIFYKNITINNISIQFDLHIQQTAGKWWQSTRKLIRIEISNNAKKKRFVNKLSITMFLFKSYKKRKDDDNFGTVDLKLFVPRFLKL